MKPGTDTVTLELDNQLIRLLASCNTNLDEVATSLARSYNVIARCPDSLLARIARLSKIKQRCDLTAPSSLVYILTGHYTHYVGQLGYANTRPPICRYTNHLEGASHFEGVVEK